MSQPASTLPSQFGLPRRLNRNISPLILDIRDYGSAFEREPAQAALPPPAALPAGEGAHAKAVSVPEPPVSAARSNRAGGLLVLLLFAAIGALGAMVMLDARRISVLERQVEYLTEQSAGA